MTCFVYNNLLEGLITNEPITKINSPRVLNHYLSIIPIILNIFRFPFLCRHIVFYIITIIAFSCTNVACSVYLVCVRVAVGCRAYLVCLVAAVAVGSVLEGGEVVLDVDAPEVE